MNHPLVGVPTPLAAFASRGFSNTVVRPATPEQ